MSDNVNAAYPQDDEEQAYLRWLEAPGEDLGMFVGDAPTIEERLAKGDTLHVGFTPEVAKAVPVARRPGSRGGKYRFNESGQVVYERQGAAPKPTTSSLTGKFDPTEHQKQIDEHSFVETTHRGHVNRLKDEMTAVRSQMSTATAGRKGVLQRKLDRLQSQHDDHRKVVSAAKIARITATGELEAAKKTHMEGQRIAADQRKEAHGAKQQREAIMAIGTNRMRGGDDAEHEPAAPANVPADRKSAPPTREAIMRVGSHTVRGEDRSSAAEKPRGTTSIWKPGDDARRDHEQRVHAPSKEKPKKQLKTTEEWYEEDTRAHRERQAAAAARAPEKKPSLFSKLRGLLRRPSSGGQLAMAKALPKEDSGDKPAKKAPQGKATSKKAGAGGKTRYGYPGEQSGSDGGGPATSAKRPQNPAQVPAEVDDKPAKADPNELATILKMSVSTLQRVAQRFHDNEKLKGRKGFTVFMKTRLKTFSSKHRLDGDYFGLIYDALVRKQ